MSEQNTTPDGPTSRRSSLPKLVLPLALLVGIVAGVSIVLLGGSNRGAAPAGAGQSPLLSGFRGTLALPSKAAPPIALRNYLGQPVTLAQYRGRAVLVTFLYTHCPDVCPLIASNLGIALRRLGPRAAQVQVIVVSVDPRGDTPAAVARFLRAHQVLGRVQYLLGSAAQLGRTWAAWGVGSTREAGRPDLVAHSALVYGVSASGRVTTVYPSSFEPGDLVHDVPKLATR